MINDDALVIMWKVAASFVENSSDACDANRHEGDHLGGSHCTPFSENECSWFLPSLALISRIRSVMYIKMVCIWMLSMLRSSRKWIWNVKILINMHSYNMYHENKLRWRSISITMSVRLNIFNFHLIDLFKDCESPSTDRAKCNYY